MAQNAFPEDFLWGASTSSHQTEGKTNNQWTVWELANADNLVKTAPARLAYLKQYKNNVSLEKIVSQATRPENYISGEGTEHFKRYDEDFSLLTSLHMNAFRFSFEWSRIEPQRGHWDTTAFDHYHRYIADLKSRHIEPVITIWHWTLPVWFAKKGGFAKKRNLEYFYEYVAKIAEEFGKDIKYVLVLNEPNVYTILSYVKGIFPPQRKNALTGIIVHHNLIAAHKQSYEILKTANQHIQVSSAISLSESRSLNTLNPISHLSVKLKDRIFNWWFLNHTREYLDFIGLNFYSTRYYTWRLQEINPKSPVDDFGNYMEPGGLYNVLAKTFRRYRLPIIITENGLADSDDKYRQWWLQETVNAMEKAIEAGVVLKGYLHWSLLDDFEWSSGWLPKFGLVAVDRKHGLKRTIRPSAKWFANYISNLAADNQPTEAVRHNDGPENHITGQI